MPKGVKGSGKGKGVGKNKKQKRPVEHPLVPEAADTGGVTETPPPEEGAGGGDTLRSRVAEAEAIVEGVTLRSLIAAETKKYGRGTLATMRGEFALRERVRGVISSGSIGLDNILGVGGYPRGRIIEIFGAEGTGKTTLCLHAIAQAQKNGGIAAFVDAEHSLDPEYAIALGCDLEKLLFAQPDCGEQALGIVEDLVDSKGVDLVVVDSVAALIPRAELEGEIGDQLPGAQARLMSQAMRHMVGRVNTSNTTVIFINQTRHKIGVMFGSPITTSGGNALKFYASIRMEVTRIGGVKKGDEMMGNRVRANIVKSKVAPPFRSVEFDLVFGVGISIEDELLDFALEKGIVQKSGSWYLYKGEQIGQGRIHAASWLLSRPAVAAEIRRLAVVDLSPKAVAETPIGTDDQ